MNKEDWLGLGLVLGLIATVGILAWISRKRGSPRAVKLVKVGRKPILRNKQTVKIIRDKEGRIQELEIHRQIHAE